LISKKGNGFSQPRNKQLNWRRTRIHNRKPKKLVAKKGDSIPQTLKSELQIVEEEETPSSPSPNTEFKITSRVVHPTKQTNLGSRIGSRRTEVIRKPSPKKDKADATNSAFIERQR